MSDLEERYGKVKGLVNYNFRTGLFSWKKIKLGRKEGEGIGHKDSEGYLFLCLPRSEGRKRVSLHRLAYYVCFNILPKEIDHINGNRADNKIENLRAVTRSENQRNRKRHREGIPVGVQKYCRSTKKPWLAMAPREYMNWKASKTKRLGIFSSMEEARLAVVEFCSKENTAYV